MNRRTLLTKIAGAVALCPMCLSVASVLAAENEKKPAAHDSGPPHWSYAGEEGPEQWGKLSPEFRVCDLGVQQSPIDLTASIPANLRGIGIDYRSTTANVVNNGHTIQVNCDPGSSITLDGTTFHLLQYHFHHPSEHLLSGRNFDLEAHFVHASDDGTLAVLGVFVQPGAHSEALAPVWSVMPRAAGKARGGVVQPADLLPAETVPTSATLGR